MTSTASDDGSVIGRDRARSIAKLTIAALALVLLAYLVSLLPGIERFVPGTRVSLVAVAGALASLAIATILVYLASRLAAVTRLALDGPPELIEHVASIVHWLVVLAAVLVAHSGLAPVVRPVLEEAMWLYDLSFLLVSLPILVVIAVRLYVAIDPAADTLVDTVAGEDG